MGKTYHKACLRCVECNTLLDSSRLTEKDGQPMCHRCYSKVWQFGVPLIIRSLGTDRVAVADRFWSAQFHGPQGSGYALLGKAGG